MTLSSMVVSRDFQEVSVLECILGGLHIGVDVESEPERARIKLAKSKIDALIVDCDLCGASSFLKGLQEGTIRNAVAADYRQRFRRPEATRVSMLLLSFSKNPSRSSRRSTPCPRRAT